MNEHPDLVDEPGDLKHGDFEEYFKMWNGVLVYPNPASLVPMRIHGYDGTPGSIPCHQHKTCLGLVFVKSRIPPRVCPQCGLDTAKEIKMVTR